MNKLIRYLQENMTVTSTSNNDIFINRKVHQVHGIHVAKKYQDNYHI